MSDSSESARLTLEALRRRVDAYDRERGVDRLTHAVVRGGLAGLTLKGLTLAIGSALSSLSRRPRSKAGPSRLQKLKSTLRITLFCASYAGIYVTADELIAVLVGKRRSSGWRSLLAGGLAGSTLAIVPTKEASTSLSVYIFVKGVVLLVRCGSEADQPAWLRRLLAPARWEHGDVLLMCLASSRVLMRWLTVEETPKSAYSRFLDRHGDKTLDVYRGVRELVARDVPGPPGVFLDALPKDSPAGRRRHWITSSFGHPGQTTLQHSLHLFPAEFRRALPVYLPVYLVPAVLVHRSRLLDPAKLARIAPRLGKGVLRSSLFLALYVTLAWAGIDVAQALYGRVSPSILAQGFFWSGLATLVEKKSRRMELALYVLSRAVEGSLPAAIDQGKRQATRGWKGANGAGAGSRGGLGGPALGAGSGSGSGLSGPLGLRASPSPQSVTGVPSGVARPSISPHLPFSSSAASPSSAVSPLASVPRFGLAGVLPASLAAPASFLWPTRGPARAAWRADVLFFAAASACILHCYSDHYGARREVFRGPYRSVFDWIFGSSGIGTGNIRHTPSNAEYVAAISERSAHAVEFVRSRSYAKLAGVVSEEGLRRIGLSRSASRESHKTAATGGERSHGSDKELGAANSIADSLGSRVSPAVVGGGRRFGGARGRFAVGPEGSTRPPVLRLAPAGGAAPLDASLGSSYFAGSDNSALNGQDQERGSGSSSSSGSSSGNGSSGSSGSGSGVAAASSGVPAASGQARSRDARSVPRPQPAPTPGGAGVAWAAEFQPEAQDGTAEHGGIASRLDAPAASPPAAPAAVRSDGGSAGSLMSSPLQTLPDAGEEAEQAGEIPGEVDAATPEAAAAPSALPPSPQGEGSDGSTESWQSTSQEREP